MTQVSYVCCNDRKSVVKFPVTLILHCPGYTGPDVAGAAELEPQHD